MKNLSNWAMELFVNKMFHSRKFWYTVIGCLTTFFSENLGLNSEEVRNLLISIGTLVLGQGFADMSKKK
jgi:uncharacterized membrane protein